MRFIARLAALAALSFASAATAADLVPVHGNLTLADGTLVDGATSITFRIYDAADTGSPVWAATRTVEVVDGNFTTYLGQDTPIDPVLFRDADSMLMSVEVAGDDETDLVPLGTVAYAAVSQFAGEADDALTLGGVSLDELREEMATQVEVEDWAKAVCFDTESELLDTLDDDYVVQAGDGIDITANVISVVETDLKALLDDDYTFIAGNGVDLTGGTLSIVEADITALLDDDYAFVAGNGLSLDSTTNTFSVVEQDLRDLLDDDYAFTFGTGLQVDANLEVSVVEKDLRDLLDDNYKSEEYEPDWADITNKPASLVPSGAIVFFAGACPSGWSEYTALRGRAVVGLPSGGTIEGTQGTALANQGTRTITDVPSHRHTVDPPNTSTSTNGNHSHGIITRQDDWNVSGGTGPSFGADNGAYRVHSGWGTSPRTDTQGNHSHTVNIAQFNSGFTGSSSVDVTMPYIQLRACEAP